MFEEFMPTIHQANDELEMGLENIDKKKAKETYNALIALSIELNRRYIRHYTEYLGRES
jgi:hypothetical protein|tara:strand:+ start:1256 stop:1432 length:177 start_codon:yes stop_codon:yes gene_type:complete